jgi:uncharacterized membrane protein YfcA
VPARVYAVLLAGALSLAAARLLVMEHPPCTLRPPRLSIAVPAGAGIGWLSGVSGVGGGIFLSPLLLMCHWADAKQTAAASACFILANSAAGLAGRCARGAIEYGPLWPLLLAALAGGLLGSHLGVHRFPQMLLRRILAIVLLVAAVKLLMTARVG